MAIKTRPKMILLTLILLTILAIISLIFRSQHPVHTENGAKKQQEVKDDTKQDYSDFANVDTGGTD